VADRLWDRRRFLVAAGLLPMARVCDTRHPGSGFLGAMERWNEKVERGLFRPEKLVKAPTAELTDDDEFPSYFISPEMPIAPAGWQLQVGGAVARPRTFSLEELQRLPRTEYRYRHYCVEGWSAVSNWHGVALRDLAAAVGAASVGYVQFRSFDSGYYSTWDRESALHPQTILAYGKNGSPLGPDHGAPLRLYSAVKLGYKMVKYLTEVTFTPIRSGGYWEDLGYEWFAGV
jgi:DMSO/TMAO reductase YedYZ molybdopterin-dependent catalytic subunit